MVPLYSLLSFLSLLMEQNSVYFDTFRDWCAPAKVRLGEQVMQARSMCRPQGSLACTLALPGF